MGDALQGEVADQKARHELGRRCLTLGALRDCLFEYLRREIDKDDVALLVEDPPRRSIGWQDRQMPRRCGRAGPAAVECALKLEGMAKAGTANGGRLTSTRPRRKRLTAAAFQPVSRLVSSTSAWPVRAPS
jgi:hypothetical protein